MILGIGFSSSLLGVNHANSDFDGFFEEFKRPAKPYSTRSIRESTLIFS